MGIHKDKSSIITSALNKISATAGIDFARDTSVLTNSYRISLDEIISEAMESFVFPFAVSYLHLTNPLTSSELDPQGLSDVYIIPIVARSVGVYKQNNLPFVVDVITQSNTLNSCSLPYSVINGDTLVTSVKAEDLYFIFVNLSPPIEQMSPNFQSFLVYKLAETIFFRTSTNARFLSYLRQNAYVKLGSAKKMALLTSSNIVRNYVTLRELTEYGNTDGTV